MLRIRFFSALFEVGPRVTFLYRLPGGCPLVTGVGAEDAGALSPGVRAVRGPLGRGSRRGASRHARWLRSRRASAGRHARRLTNFACAHFFPDPWGWPPRTSGPGELSPWPRPRFASPRLCPPSRRTRPIPPATTPPRNPPGAIAENVDGSHGHSPIPSARLSTDIRCAGHRRSRKRPGVAASASAPLPVGVDTCAWRDAVELVSGAQPSPKTRQKLPRILSLASWTTILP
jgi:hypothetical protein